MLATVATILAEWALAVLPTGYTELIALTVVLLTTRLLTLAPGSMLLVVKCLVLLSLYNFWAEGSRVLKEDMLSHLSDWAVLVVDLRVATVWTAAVRSTDTTVGKTFTIKLQTFWFLTCALLLVVCVIAYSWFCTFIRDCLWERDCGQREHSISSWVLISFRNFFLFISYDINERLGFLFSSIKTC